MAIGFASDRQEALFGIIVDRLKGIGYRGELFQPEYPFVDWFDPRPDLLWRTVPAAVFARTPTSYNTACFGITIPNGCHGEGLINQLRALGAPYAFEVRDDDVAQWAVGRDSTKTKLIRSFGPDQIEWIFQEFGKTWEGTRVLEDKNIAIKVGPRDDFIDLGLIPALEHHIQAKLDGYLRDTINDAIVAYRDSRGKAPNVRRLFRTTFWFVAAKVLHDRGIAGFQDLQPSDPGAILKAVGDYYHDQHPIIQDVPTQQAIASGLWGRISFANLSVEILSYIYENTFVDKKTRDRLGIHGTPYSLARYVTYNLPIGDIPRDERFIVEPCCGHSIFLVAALQRLRELLPPEVTPEERHAYFVRMLSGFDIDPFALEVARLCLRIADYPNRAQWELHEQNVYNSDLFKTHIERARVVLCNPPFQDFEPDDLRENPGIKYVQRPAELLRRVIEGLPRHGLLGFIMPRPFLDGASYRPLRRVLAERYDDIEVVALPDKVFNQSEVESALLLCKHPADKPEGTRVAFIHVGDRNRSRFLTQYEHPRPEIETKTPAQVERSLKVIALRDVWDHLNRCVRLESVAEIHRGIEWQAPFDEKRYVSRTKQPDFERGVRIARRLKAFVTPTVEYLSVRPEDRRGGAYALPWSEPKVMMGARRVSRFPWCIAAFPDETGLMCTQNFHAIWPSGDWTIKTLAAVLNGPVASAFVAVRENKRDIHKRTVRSIPLPRLTKSEITRIDSLIDDYISLIDFPLLQPQRNEQSILLEIDAAVLRGYDLKPRLERTLLDFFRGYRRPVLHPFGPYFPESFSAFVPLWMYLSSEFRRSTAANFLNNLPEIKDPVLYEAMADTE